MKDKKVSPEQEKESEEQSYVLNLFIDGEETEEFEMDEAEDD